jgi:hypothetical protein
MENAQISKSMGVPSNPQKPLCAAVDAFLSEICVICGHLCFLKCKDLLDALHSPEGLGNTAQSSRAHFRKSTTLSPFV